MRTVSCVQDTTKVSATGEFLVPVVWYREQLPLALRRFVVDPGTGCWLWTGPPNAAGHGQLHTPNGTTTAHRAVYEALIGPLHSDLALHHLCPNRLCVNPLHVLPKIATQHRSDHCKEKWAGQKADPSKRLIGPSTRRGPLTEEQRQSIRDLYLSRWGTMQEIADFIGCSRHTVHNVIHEQPISPSRKRASHSHRGISGSTGPDLLSGAPAQTALETPALTSPKCGRRVGTAK